MGKVKVPFTVQRTSPVCVRLEFDKLSSKQEQWMLITSCRHHDNPCSNLAKQLEHLKEARARRAAIMDLGDFLCVMQLPGDPRASPGGKRVQHNQNDYLDLCIDEAVEFAKPFAENFAVLGTGNHETAVYRKTTINPTAHIAKGLRTHGSQVVACGYRGYVRCRFRATATQSHTKLLYWSHSFSGTEAASKRRAISVHDADIILTGHNHTSKEQPFVRYRLGTNDVEYLDEQTHVQIPTYKEAQANRDGGWEHERELMPWAQGGAWIRFYLKNESVAFDITRAQ